MRTKRKSEQANTNVMCENCQRIEIFSLNLLHKIGTNIFCMFQKFPFIRELLHNKQIHHSQIDPFSYNVMAALNKEPRFRSMEYESW